MTAHRLPHDGLLADRIILDVGAGNDIVATIDRGYVPLISAAAEARGLKDPLKAGIRLTLFCKTYVGDITVTADSQVDNAGSLTLVFGAQGEWVDLLAVDEGADFNNPDLQWRVVGGEGVGGALLADAADISIADAGAFTANTNLETATQEIYQGMISTQGIIWLPFGSFMESADGDPIVKHVNGANAFPGYFTSVATEALGLRWNNDGTPLAAATNFLMPPDCDITANMTVHMLASKTSTEAIATTFTLTAFNNHPTAGALYDADASFGGVSSAMSNPGVAKSVEEVTLTLALANLAAFPNIVHLTVNPTPGTLTTDDVILHAMWIEYTTKILTS